jgi:hypothetical protein
VFDPELLLLGQLLISFFVLLIERNAFLIGGTSPAFKKFKGLACLLSPV